MPSVSKYLPFLPISDYSSFVSLSEGSTPLIKSRSIGKDLGIELYFKYESHNPTGSFKDRGSAVEITIAKELKAKAVVVASTGNMAASIACYAAAAGIPCYVFVPEGSPTSKLVQVIAYGGNIIQVRGNYHDAINVARNVAEQLSYYLAGDYAFRVEGHKTAAFEIADQLFFRVPDIVVVPMGAGTNIAGYWKGFKEYKELEFIDKTPRMFGVQAEGVCPIVKSFEKNTKIIIPWKDVKTIASGIAVDYPLDGVKALDVIEESKGSAVSVSDADILKCQYMLAKREGLFVESSSAASVAALVKLGREKVQETTAVCVLTGNGLKDPAPVFNSAQKPITINPDVKEFLQLHSRI
ncbi:MAG: threonine synthase [Planctomycetes bacterium]|nr:threonine synthase [Planctomycetota bacterium]